jgi:cysteine desulfurase family protein
MIYLDNAATSRPKAPGVLEAMTKFMTETGANPGRSSHQLSIEAARIVSRVREDLAELFGAADPLRVVLTHNVTYAINIALRSLLRPGDHVITTSVEHNSMMRPLTALAQSGIDVTVVECSPEGTVNVSDIEEAILPSTAMIAVTHASNVLGTLMPVGQIGALARQKGLLMLVDTASTAGCVPIDIHADCIDILAFTGHKYLLGPTGTGGLVLSPDIDTCLFKPVFQGGTGSRSANEQQPEFLPDLLECGTHNTVGIAGLGASLAWIKQQGVSSIRQQCAGHTSNLLEQLNLMENVHVLGPDDIHQRTSTVAFTIDGISPSQAGRILENRYGILCRVGLHCAPRAHRTAGTFPHGSIRFSAGIFTTREEIKAAVDAVRDVSKGSFTS